VARENPFVLTAMSFISSVIFAIICYLLSIDL
jgi:hypothetical protein